jgi:hypothetical protein
VLSRTKTYPDETVLGLKLLLRCLIVVNQSKSSASPSTESSAESKRYYSLLVGLIHRSELFGQLLLRNVGTSRMKNIENKLATGEETVGNEFPCAESNRR